MNYQKHYELLCNRAKNRQLNCYTENHHVIPKCLGGDDSTENLVALTPEEHYVAHQLLVKMHPEHKGLVWAALMMTGHSKNDQRNNNKIYGWLKRKWSQECKKRKGKKNGSFGRSWYHHPETLENKKCLPDEVPNDFVKGRKMKPDQSNNRCLTCGNDTGSLRAKYCKKHRYRKTKFNKPDRSNPQCLTCGNDTGSLRAKYCKKHRYKGFKHSKETKKKMSIQAKRRFSDPTKNTQYGTRWIHSLKNDQTKKIPKNNPIPEGWVPGLSEKHKMKISKSVIEGQNLYKPQ